MACCMTCLKVLMVLLNVVAFLFGAVLAAAGGILIWGKAIIKSLLSSVLDQLESLTSSSGSSSYSASSTEAASSSTSSTASTDLIDYIMELLKYIGVPLLVIGCFVVVFALCGMIGTCCSSRCLLIVYLIMSGLLILLQIVFIILYNADDTIIKNLLKNELSKTETEYEGLQATNVESIIWNLLHSLLKCCGVSNGDNFVVLTTWNRTFYSNGVVFNMTYPYTCCKLNSDFTVKDATCPQVFDTVNSNSKDGCYTKLVDLLDEYSPIIFGALGGLVAYQVMQFVFVICIMKSMAKVHPH